MEREREEEKEEGETTAAGTSVLNSGTLLRFFQLFPLDQVA